MLYQFRKGTLGGAQRESGGGGAGTKRNVQKRSAATSGREEG